MGGRKYEKSLVETIRARQYVQVEDGLETIYKPVPDDDRPHAMDPRLYEIAAMKKKMFAQRASGGWKLSNERFRPDKVTYDLTETLIEESEFLIPILGDHMIDLYMYRPQGEDGVLPVMIYFHGGGMTAGDMKLYRNQMKLIAEKAHAAVFFPEYRLAPECPFPGPIDDCWGTITYVHDHAEELKIDPGRLMVAGDSAGGQLTNSCFLKDTQGWIRKIFELYPAFDSRNYHDIEEYTWTYDAYPCLPEQKDVVYSRIDRIKAPMDVPKGKMLNLYTQGKVEDTDPMVSLIMAPDEVLKHFPEAVIAYAEFDYLRIGVQYAGRRLHSLGVPVKMIQYCGCDHGFLDMLGTVVQAEECCWTIADEIKKM
jgi:acetyl esterase